jgi:hypothetical protein
MSKKPSGDFISPTPAPTAQAASEEFETRLRKSRFQRPRRIRKALFSI